MEDVVIDASAVITVLIAPGQSGDRLRHRLEVARLHGPAHLPVEVINVLRRRRNAGALSPGEALLALDTFWLLPIELWPLEPFVSRVWELGSNLTSYDAAYVALAEHVGSPVVTADARLSRAPGPVCEIELFG